MDFSLADEQVEVMRMARGLARKHADGPHVSWHDAGTFNWDFYRDLADHGLTGINLPEHQGGQGLSLLDAVLVIEAVSSTAPHLGDAVQASNFGAIRQISAFASDQVVDEVLREILAARGIPSIAMSEPDAGSAVSHLKTKATIDGDTVRVTGQKIFNTHGPIATHYVVWARFSDEKDGVGAVVVPADSPGFSRGKTERFISGEVYCSLYFDDVVVPRDYVLMERDGIRRMLTIFNIERMGNASRSLALGELACQLATGHLLDRSTGGRRLADHQGLQWKLADIRMQLDAARLLLYRAATDLPNGVPDPSHVAMAKCMCNEAGFKAADTAMQLFGGYGYTPDYPIDYLWKRTRGWMIAGGSVEVMRNRVAAETFKRYRPVER